MPLINPAGFILNPKNKVCFKMIHSKRYLQNDTFKKVPSRRYLQNDTFRMIPSKRYLQKDTFKVIPSKWYLQNDTVKKIPSIRYLQNDTFKKIPSFWRYLFEGIILKVSSGINSGIDVGILWNIEFRYWEKNWYFGTPNHHMIYNKY